MLILSPPSPIGTFDDVGRSLHLSQQSFDVNASMALSIPTSLAHDKCRLFQTSSSRKQLAAEFKTSDIGFEFLTRELTMSAADASQSLDPCLVSIKQPASVFNGTHLDWPNTEGWDILRELHHGGGFSQAVKVVDAMVKEGNMVYSVVFSQLLQQCIKEKDLVAGRCVHSLIIGSGCEADYMLGSSLVHMFAVCGSLAEAIQVFSKLRKKNIYSWTALIEAHVESGHSEQAIQVYYELEKLDLGLDGHVFVAVLKACSSFSTLEHGKHIHSYIMETGFDFDVFVGSALIDMYAKCGSLCEAYIVFDRLSKGNVVTWSALIAGYVEHGHGKDALQLFRRMEQEDIEPNEVTFISILKACSSLAALELGKCMHLQIIEKGLESNLVIGNSLIDMYSKCGSLSDALMIFHRMLELDVVSWSSLIGGYAKHNNYESAIHIFESMQKKSIKPNAITYLSVLSACSHVGLLSEACDHFRCMIETHCVWPALEHYNALVDILGRSGYLDGAEDLMETLPFGSNNVGWVSVLDACRLCKDVCRGKRCFDKIVSIEDGNALGYVLMSSIYARTGLWEDFKKIEELRKCANLLKKPAKAYIEVHKVVHEFIVDDNSHPQSHEIYEKLSALEVKMKEVGYTPQKVVKSTQEPKKEESLCGHSEKLAIAFGLISTAQGTTIRVAKNLRVCTDCHNAVKLLSKMELREIVIADAYRIHQFKDGECSCKDEYT